jgi:hypothetical protein
VPKGNAPNLEMQTKFLEMRSIGIFGGCGIGTLTLAQIWGIIIPLLAFDIRKKFRYILVELILIN